MKWMGLNELKEVFLNFFVNKEHKNLKSFSLVPEEDFSLLFINSGMAPMKKWFLNFETPPSKRVVTAQRCIRTPDIERVGKTDRHGTFFEMLGNFSFGDYFKREAIFWAWEFVTKVLKIPKNNLYVTVYEKDFETFKIWEDEVKVLSSHITTLGKEDNFWEIGVGPCGPCSACGTGGGSGTSVRRRGLHCPPIRSHRRGRIRCWVSWLLLPERM